MIFYAFCVFASAAICCYVHFCARRWVARFEQLRNQQVGKLKLALDCAQSSNLRQHREHMRALDARDESLKTVVEKLCLIHPFRLEDCSYGVQVRINPKAMHSAFDRMEREFIMREMAEQVYNELMSARFVEPPMEHVVTRSPKPFRLQRGPITFDDPR